MAKNVTIVLKKPASKNNEPSKASNAMKVNNALKTSKPISVYKKNV